MTAGSVADPKDAYTRARDAHRASAGALGARSRSIGTARLLVAVAAVAVIVAMTWGPIPRLAGWSLEAGLVALFVALVVLHARVEARRERAELAVTFHERGLARLADDAWRALPDAGAMPDGSSPDAHPYAGDLDVLGKASLYKLVAGAQTPFGERTLATWLLAAHAPPSADAIRERQAAVRELSADLSLRERLWVQGGALKSRGVPDVGGFLSWAESSAQPAVGPVGLVFARAWPIVTLAAMVVGHVLRWPAGLSFGPYVVGFAAAFVWRRSLGPVIDAVASREGSVAAFGEMLRTAEDASFEAPRLKEVHAAWRRGGTTATAAMRSLGAVCSFLEAQSNEVFRIFLSPLFMLDANAAVALERWRARHGRDVRGWLEALGELEALESLSSLAFDQPDYAWPELVEEACFEAEALAHPLLAASRRVANDVTIPGPGTALLVTGSNMSGKSTLLRAVGLAAVLAVAGAPVCAKRLRLGAVRVATSMRTSDSLAEGTSRFLAEVKRLRLVVDMAHRAPGLLFLLDEILHGTNSRERVLGARAVLSDLLEHGALGAMSTHDLGLAHLDDEHPGRVRNVHFQEQVEGDTMTFDYRLREGVVQSSNALRLMKMVGLDVQNLSSEPGSGELGSICSHCARAHVVHRGFGASREISGEERGHGGCEASRRASARCPCRQRPPKSFIDELPALWGAAGGGGPRRLLLHRLRGGPRAAPERGARPLLRAALRRRCAGGGRARARPRLARGDRGEARGRRRRHGGALARRAGHAGPALQRLRLAGGRALSPRGRRGGRHGEPGAGARVARRGAVLPAAALRGARGVLRLRAGAAHA